MATIFTSNPIGTESWSAQGAVVTWNKGSSNPTGSRTYNGSSAGMIPILMQQISLTYQRTIQSLYPLNQVEGGLRKCNITGAPRGQLNIVGIYAPTNADLDDFLEAVSKPCKTDKDQINIRLHPYAWGGCSTKQKSNIASGGMYSNSEFILKGIELESLGFSISAGENALSQMPLTFSFTELVYNADNMSYSGDR